MTLYLFDVPLTGTIHPMCEGSDEKKARTMILNDNQAGGVGAVLDTLSYLSEEESTKETFYGSRVWKLEPIKKEIFNLPLTREAFLGRIKEEQVSDEPRDLAQEAHKIAKGIPRPEEDEGIDVDSPDYMNDSFVDLTDEFPGVGEEPKKVKRYLFFLLDREEDKYNVYTADNLEFLQGIITAIGWVENTDVKDSLVHVFENGVEMEIEGV